MPEDYLSVLDLARKFSVHPETIRRWARTKKIKGKRFGKFWYFPKESTTL